MNECLLLEDLVKSCVRGIHTEPLAILTNVKEGQRRGLCREPYVCMELGARATAGMATAMETPCRTDTSADTGRDLCVTV